LAAAACFAAPACSDSPTADPAAESTAADAAARVQAALPRFRDATPPTKSAPAMAEPRKLAGAGRSDEAIRLLEALAPRDSTGEAAFLLGSLHCGRERHALALPWLERALEHGPTFPKARQLFYLYGRCLQETGDLAGARAAYEADASLFPDQADGLHRLALLDLEEGDLDRCETRARAALERFERPRDLAKTHALLADVHLARGDRAAARAALERCVQAFPHYEALYKLSRVCAQLGDEPAAAHYLEEHRRWRARAGR